jgi:hypothetical protein
MSRSSTVGSPSTATVPSLIAAARSSRPVTRPMRLPRVRVKVVEPSAGRSAVPWASTPLRSSHTCTVLSSVMTNDRVRCSCQARGPSTRMATEERICSTVRAPSRSGESGETGCRTVAVAQLVGAAQERVAPGAVLGSEAELLEHVGLQGPGGHVVLVGEDDVVEHLGGPAQVAVLERPSGLVDRSVGAAHGLHVALARGGRRVGPQPGRVALVPAHVALVDRLHVVADRPVVAVDVPGRLERRRQLDHLGDLATDPSLVHEPQRLVVQVGVHVALHREELDSPLPAPRRPVVRGEHHVELVAPQRDRLGEVGRPRLGVAHLGAADGEDVVQRVRGVLGGAQRPRCGK